MPQDRRITQKDVASVAQVDRATVSLALRNHPSIPEHTRDRIKKAAEKLGYAPDPMLVALASYRNRGRAKSFHSTLGWIVHTTREYDWRKVSHFTAYFDAAKVRAQALGYRIEVIDVGRLDDSWSRAGSIARARGMQGLLICPLPTANTDLMSFPWDRFSSVTFGYSLLRPSLHSVTAAHFRAACRTMEQLYSRGYARVGFATTTAHDQRTDHNFLGGYLAARNAKAGSGDDMPVFVGRVWDDPQLEKWYWKHRPDAILTTDVSFVENAAAWKRRLSPGVGIACPLIASPRSSLSGIWENNSLVGEAAVDFLVSLVNRGERGVPAHPQRLLIEGSWLEGSTVRERPPAGAKDTHVSE